MRKAAAVAAWLGVVAAIGLALASCAGGSDRGNTSGTAGTTAQAAGTSGGAAGVNGAAGTTAAAGVNGSAGTMAAAGVNGAAGTTVTDGGAAGGNGTEAGTDLASDKGGGDAPAACPGAGKALHFEDDLAGTKTKSTQLLADLGNDLPIGDAARTIEFWLYMEGNESWKSEHSIVEYGGQGRCQAFGIDGGDNGTKDPPQFDPFTFSSGGPCTGDDDGNITPAPPRTGWLHLAWVYDPKGTLAYSSMTGLNFMFTVNGVPQNIPAKKQSGALLTLKTMVTIGSGQITDNGFTGKMDEFRMWNVARTPAEIADNYKMILKGNEPGLIAYYHFDEGTGTVAKDASAAKHDANFVTDGGRPVPKWVDPTGLTLTCKP